MEGSNLAPLQPIVQRTQGVDVAPFIRAALAGDTRTISSELVAALTAWLDLFDPEVEIDFTGVDMPGFGVAHGFDGMSQLWRRWTEEWDRYSWTHSNWSELGEHVVVDVQIQATGKGSGANVIWDHCQVFTFRDAK
jgi:hypothetical protein